MPNTDKNLRPLHRKLFWFFGIWATSAAALAIFVYGLRAIFQL